MEGKRGLGFMAETSECVQLPRPRALVGRGEYGHLVKLASLQCLLFDLSKAVFMSMSPQLFLSILLSVMFLGEILGL